MPQIGTNHRRCRHLWLKIEQTSSASDKIYLESIDRIGTNNLAIRKNYIRKTKKCRLIFHLWNNFQIFISEFVVFFSFSNPKMLILIYVCLICSNDGIQMTLFLCLNYARKNPFLYLILIKCLYSQMLKYLLWLLWKILCRNNIKYFMFWLMILLLIHH